MRRAQRIISDREDQAKLIAGFGKIANGKPILESSGSRLSLTSTSARTLFGFVETGQIIWRMRQICLRGVPQYLFHEYAIHERSAF
jgi:hypothetical protein